MSWLSTRERSQEGMSLHSIGLSLWRQGDLGSTDSCVESD